MNCIKKLQKIKTLFQSSARLSRFFCCLKFLNTFLYSLAEKQNQLLLFCKMQTIYGNTISTLTLDKHSRSSNHRYAYIGIYYIASTTKAAVVGGGVVLRGSLEIAVACSLSFGFPSRKPRWETCKK